MSPVIRIFKGLFLLFTIMLSTSFANEHIRSVRESPELVSLLEEIELSYEASGFFFYEEIPSKNFITCSTDWTCNPVSAFSIIAFLRAESEYFNLPVESVDRALTDFEAIIGKGPFTECRTSEVLKYYDVIHTIFESKSGDYSISFTIAWEN